MEKRKREGAVSNCLRDCGVEMDDWLWTLGYCWRVEIGLVRRAATSASTWMHGL